MLKVTKAAVLAVALAVPVAGFAAQADAKKPASTKKEHTMSHTTSGTVKSSSDTSLVITKGSGKSAKDETFAVNASTKKEGDIATGAKVTVAYTMDGANMVATSVKAAAPHAAKKPAAKK
jgi:cytoskeletal protein RodZ